MMANKPSYFLDSEADKKRLQRQHELIKDAMGGRLIIAPIDLTREDLKVLDAGTSDGFWIRDFLQDYPAVKTVVGTDIDEIRFPTDMPENVTLFRQDMLEQWPTDWKESFDLVHQRLLLVGSRGDPQPIANRLFELVKPGGWVQLIEADQVVGENDGPAQRQFLKLMEAMVNFMTTPFYFAREMSRYLREAGFIKIGEMTIPLAQGAACPNPDLREQSIQSFLVSIGGLIEFGKSLPSIEGISKDDLESLSSRCEAELRERGGYYPLRAVWGQRPLN